MDALAAEVQYKIGEAVQHSYPFEKLLEDLKEKTGKAQKPVHIMAGFLDMPVCTEHGVSRIVSKGTAINALEYDVGPTFVMEAQEEGPCIQLQCNSQALDDSTANKLLDLHILE